ncbi:hypothetical protein ABIE52_006947 [Rhodococcus sp. OAS809]|uniref:hypothetical protein n=1 Tax=Rhodococcus TaxID=1827 RepID=UPI0007E58DA5|nr:hypothetical protein [Rhodococcus qingshengii]BCF86327.1 hypothetical protein RQCS_58720 [Rhodococcus qingshengii]
MKVKNKAMVAGVLAGAAAMTVLGTGVAQAADPQWPSANYQLCGNVRDSGGAGVGGVSISGDLYDPTVSSTVPVASYPIPPATVTTAADGGYCLQGASSLVNVIQNNGGWVKLHGTKAGTPVNFGTWESSGIYLSDFFSQWAFPLQSAYGFDGVY